MKLDVLYCLCQLSPFLKYCPIGRASRGLYTYQSPQVVASNRLPHLFASLGLSPLVYRGTVSELCSSASKQVSILISLFVSQNDVLVLQHVSFVVIRYTYTGVGT